MQKTATELACRVPAILPATQQLLAKYRWPGNVRELRQCLRQALIRSDGLERLPVHFALGPSAGAGDLNGSQPAANLDYDSARLEFDRSYFRAVLAANNGNKQATARQAGLSRDTLYSKLRACGILGPAIPRE